MDSAGGRTCGRALERSYSGREIVRFCRENDVTIEVLIEGHERRFRRISRNQGGQVRESSDCTGVVLKLDDVIVIAVFLRVLYHSDQRLFHFLPIDRNVALKCVSMYVRGGKRVRDDVKRGTVFFCSCSYPKEPVTRVFGVRLSQIKQLDGRGISFENIFEQ